MESEKSGFTNKMSEIWRKMQVKSTALCMQYSLDLHWLIIISKAFLPVFSLSLILICIHSKIWKETNRSIIFLYKNIDMCPFLYVLHRKYFSVGLFDCFELADCHTLFVVNWIKSVLKNVFLIYLEKPSWIQFPANCLKA